MISQFGKPGYSLLLASCIFILSCKKDNSSNNNNNNNNNQQVSIVGKWTVVYFVAANIYAQGIGPNDTTYTTHDETVNFTTDSIFYDTWYATRYDFTVHPPVFSVSDTNEDIYNRGYIRNGNQIYEMANGIVKDTAVILKLTDSELLLHYTIPPNFGFNDSYIYLNK